MSELRNQAFLRLAVLKRRAAVQRAMREHERRFEQAAPYLQRLAERRPYIEQKRRERR